MLVAGVAGPERMLLWSLGIAGDIHPRGILIATSSVLLEVPVFFPRGDISGGGLMPKKSGGICVADQGTCW